MENKNDLYIGHPSRPRTCPVCLRTKEDAIAEQLQSGKSCGHERCEFKSEMELIFIILDAPDIEQIKSLTCESVETSKKTYDLLVTLRESVKALKANPDSENRNDAGKIGKIHPESFNKSAVREFELTGEQLQSIYRRIDHSTKALSTLIEKKKDQSNGSTGCQSAEDYDANQALKDLPALAERIEKDRQEWVEYLKSRAIFNQQMDAAWAKVDKSLKEMHEVVEVMKMESDQNLTE